MMRPGDGRGAGTETTDPSDDGGTRRLLKGGGLITLGNVAGAGLGLVLLVLLSRFFAPADLARIVAVIAIIDGGQMLLDASFNTGMINVASRNGRKRAPDPAALKAGLVAKLWGAGALAFAVVLVSGPMSVAFVGSNDLRPAIALAGLATVLAAVASFVQAVLQAREDFPRVAMLSPVKNLVRVAIVLGLVWLGAADATLTAVAICAASAAALLVAVPMISWSFLRDRAPSRSVRKQLRAVNKWMILSAVAMFGGRLDLWLVGALSTPEQAGYYAVAGQLCVGVGILTQSLVATLLPSVSRFDSTAEMGQFLRRWAKVAPLLIALPLVVWPLSRPLVTLAFGSNYGDAAAIFNILFLASVMTLSTAPLMLVLLALREARLMGLGAMLQLVFRVAGAFPVVPVFGGIGLAVLDVSSRILAMAIILGLVLSVLKRGGAGRVAPVPLSPDGSGQ